MHLADEAVKFYAMLDRFRVIAMPPVKDLAHARGFKVDDIRIYLHEDIGHGT